MTLHTLPCSWSFKQAMLTYLLRFAAMCSVLCSISVSALAQVILSAERDSPAVRDFALELAQTLPSHDIIYMPRSELEQQQNFTADTQLILLGPELLDWRLRLEQSNPPTLMMQVSRVQARQRIQKKQSKHLSFIWSDPPLERQIELLKLMQPDIHHVAVIYSQDSIFLAPEMMRALQAAGMLMHAYVLSEQGWSDHRATRSLNYLLDSTDALLGIDDPQVYNPTTIKRILLSNYARKQALIGPTAAFIKAGSLASTYTNKEGWINTLQQLLLTPPDTWPYSMYPTDFKAMVNQQVARSLGIQQHQPDEITKLLQQHRLTP
ncbi:MAG TPA: ABC transporter substrate-binding protein [Thiopseudomonas sp.]|nr:ABC transporter substrate-binding protein [Thiopseudomonas sp.]